MKVYYFYLSALIFLLACGATPKAPITIDSSLIEETVAFLASDELQGRKGGTEQGRQAARWIEEKIKGMNFQSWPSESFSLPFTLPNGSTGQNIVGYVAGKGELAKEWVILSAHYDHIGIIEAIDGDSIANGADDNATGVGTMLALGKAGKTWIEQTDNSRSLMIVAFDGEEMGLRGSKHFVDSVLLQTLDSSQVIANLNFEMLGKYAAGEKGQAFLTGSKRSSLISVLQNAGETHNWKLIDDPFEKFKLYYRSDNASFAKRGMIAHTLSTDPIDQDSLYHSVNDEIESLDFEHTKQVAEGIFYGLKMLLKGAKVE